MNGWWATLSDAERGAVLLMIAPDEVFMYRDVSQGMLSIARHRSGAMIDGHRFCYFAASDELVRHDVMKIVESMRKIDRALKREAAKSAQSSLL